MPISPSRRWVGGQRLLTTQMNRDISDIEDELAGRDGVVELEGSLLVPSGAGGDGYIILPRTDDLDAVAIGERGIIYNNDDDELYVITDTERRTVRRTVLANYDITGVFGTTAGTISEGNHTHG